MKTKDTGIVIIALIVLVVLLALDFVAIPLLLKIILEWFGVFLSFGQCFIITIFLNIITHSIRKG